MADFTAKDRDYVATMPDNPENKIIWPKRMEIRRDASDKNKFILYVEGVARVDGGLSQVRGDGGLSQVRGDYEIVFDLSNNPEKRVLQNMPEEAFQSIF